MPGSFRHLATRFFDYLRASSLDVEEVRMVVSWLSEDERGIFFAQGKRDQAHGYQTALTVLDAGVDDPHVIRAALLHDIGKRHARLGVIGRVVASLLIKAHVPLRGRMRIYRDHGSIGSDELASIGSPRLVSDFTRHHHGKHPSTIPIAVWELLQHADSPRKAGVAGERR